MEASALWHGLLQGSCSSIAIAMAIAISVPLLFLVWKHHPSYGANPGLPSFPLLGCLPSILLNRHRFYLWTCEVFDRTPSLTCKVSIGLSTGVSTANPSNVQHILKTRFLAYPKGPSFYPYFSDLLGSGIFNADGDLWRLQRKVASHEFTSNSLKDFVLEVAETEICDRLLPLLHAARDSGRCFDLQNVLKQFTFDTICQLTFGADPACLGNSETVDDSVKGFAGAFDTALRVIAYRFLTPTFVWKTKRALGIGDEKKLKDALTVVNRFAVSVIEKRKGEILTGRADHRNDLLSRFMRITKSELGHFLDEHQEGTWKAQEGEKGKALSDSFMKDILLSFLLAGRDAVASGVTFLIWLLSCHPRVEKAVFQELNGILKARESDQNSQSNASAVRSFSFDELKRMNYLHAALSESMRLYPPAPSDCKYAAQDDTLPDGTQVRKGYQVAYNVFAMGRAERLWGKDYNEFKPERWLGEDGQFVPENPYKYPVFQAGPRICLGKDFAYIQMKIMVASLVREFKFKVSPQYEPKLTFGVNLFMENGLPVTVERR